MHECFAYYQLEGPWEKLRLNLQMNYLELKAIRLNGCMTASVCSMRLLFTGSDVITFNCEQL